MPEPDDAPPRPPAVSASEYAETCRSLCRLGVPWLADLAVIDMLGEHGIEWVATYHADPALDHLVHSMFAGLRITAGGHHPVGRVLRTGQPHLAQKITEDDLRAALPTEQAAQA